MHFSQIQVFIMEHGKNILCGLQGWTLEEIVKYVMEMPETTTLLYQETLEQFDDAMNKEDQDAILEQYHLLKEMLHPDNPLCRLLSIQGRMGELM